MYARVLKKFGDPFQRAPGPPRSSGSARNIHFGATLQFYHGKRSLEQELDLTLANVEKFGNDIKLTYIKE